jgi:hypothetical protein
LFSEKYTLGVLRKHALVSSDAHNRLHVPHHGVDAAVAVPVLIQILILARGAQEAVLLQRHAVAFGAERGGLREHHGEGPRDAAPRASARVRSGGGSRCEYVSY